MYCFVTNVIPHRRCHALFIISFNGECQRGLLSYFLEDAKPSFSFVAVYWISFIYS